MIRAQKLVLTAALLFKEAVESSRSGSEASTEHAGKNVGGSQVHELKTS